MLGPSESWANRREIKIQRSCICFLQSISWSWLITIHDILICIKLFTDSKTHLPLVTEGHEGSSLHLNLLPRSVEELDHEVEEVGFPQVGGRLLGELRSADGTPRNSYLSGELYMCSYDNIDERGNWQ